MVTYMLWVWLAIVVVAVVLEFATAQLVSVWFAVGGVVSLLLSIIPNFSVVWQVVIFGLVSGALLLSLRSITKRWLSKKSEGRTNLSLIIGQRVKLLTPCDQDTLGSTKINDIVWSVQEQDGKSIDIGGYAEVVKISGNKLIVKKEDK